MKNKGFTLIELLVSIILFGMITILLFGTIDNFKKQLSFYKSKDSIINEKIRILSILRNDFDRAETLKLSTNMIDKDFTTASITNSNLSLYKIDKPFVTWVVLKRNNTLVRLESSKPILLPVTMESNYFVHSDVIGENCSQFRIYNSETTRLIYLKFEEKPPLIIEVTKNI
jgi:prepilin-type N-terminal cleavage/methylation domain-containing protein